MYTAVASLKILCFSAKATPPPCHPASTNTPQTYNPTLFAKERSADFFLYSTGNVFPSKIILGCGSGTTASLTLLSVRLVWPLKLSKD